MNKAILSIHDIAPSQLSAVQEIISDLKAQGVTAVNLALVPVFHQAESWRRNEEPAAVIESLQTHFRTEILLHGFYHQRVGSNETLPWRNRLRSWLQSADEDEFYGLGVGESKDRIRKGLAVLAEVFKSKPVGFIPPSWAPTKTIMGILGGLGFLYTEDHFHIIDLRTGRKTPSPVIAFSSRSPLHRSLSLLWSYGVYKLAGRKRILRVVLHPADFRSPRIRAFALGLIKKLNGKSDWHLYRDVISGDCNKRHKSHLSLIHQRTDSE